MPCYTEPPTAEEKEQFRNKAKKKGEWSYWYKLTSKDTLAQWLCDALRGNPISADCKKWHELHKKHHDKE